MNESKTAYQLDEERQRIEKEFFDAILREKPDVIDKMKQDIMFYGITSEDLGFTSKPSSSTSKVKLKPTVKYRKGDKTWSGRGRAPQWVRDIKVNPNENIDDFLER